MQNLARSLLIAAAIAFSTSAASAQNSFWIGHETHFADGNAGGPRLNGAATHQFNEALGLRAFFLARDRFGQAYIGPTLSLKGFFPDTDAVEIFGGVGYSTAEDPMVYAGSIFAQKGKDSALLVIETGDSYWYRFQLKHRFADNWSAGVMGQEKLGWGPMLERKFGKSPVSIWGAGLYDRQTDNVNFVIGTQISF